MKILYYISSELLLTALLQQKQNEQTHLTSPIIPID